MQQHHVVDSNVISEERRLLCEQVSDCSCTLACEAPLHRMERLRRKHRPGTVEASQRRHDQVPFVWHEGYPRIKGAIAYVTCQVIDIHPAGDHTLYIGQVEHLGSVEEQAPLRFYRGKYR